MIAGKTYKFAGLEAYSKYDEGRHELLSLRAVFCRVNETPRSGASIAMFKEMLNPQYKAQEVYHLSADEILRATLCAQPGMVSSRFDDAAKKAQAIQNLVADLGVENMRTALEYMTRLRPDNLPRFEGLHFVATEKLTPKA